MDVLSITIPGQPVPQPRPRFAAVGRMRKSYTAKGPIQPYRAAITLMTRQAAKATGRRDTAAFRIAIDAAFARPDSHFKKGGGLTSKAPKWPPKADVDNVAKGVMDAITDSGAVWKDDTQVVELRVRKRYVADGSAETVILVQEVALDAPT